MLSNATNQPKSTVELGYMCPRGLSGPPTIKSIYLLYSTSSFLINQREMNTAVGVLTFFYLGYLKDKEYTLPKTCTDRLKRTIIRDMRHFPRSN